MAPWKGRWYPVRWLIVLFFLTLSLPIRAQEGLRYRIQLWMRGDEQAMEARFRLQSTAGTRTHNKVQKPRMGGWRLEADRTEGTPYAQAMLLGRAERLLYLAGPSPQTRPEPISLRFGHRSLPVWSLEMPRGLQASTVLVEVAPKLLALCDLSVRFEQGDMARLELHLEGLDDTAGLAPAEAGTTLLSTLRAWALEAGQPVETSVTVR
jgi:hypothetical protein